VLALQGDLSFAAVEAVVRRIVDVSGALDAVVLDLRRVARTERGAVAVLAELIAALVRGGTLFVLVGTESHGAFVRQLDEHIAAEQQGGGLPTFNDLDAALEWCEERLLNGDRSDEAVSLSDHLLATGLDLAGVRALAAELTSARFDQGATIVRQGDRAEEIFLLMRGRVSVTVDVPGGLRKRLATVSPGMIFGEITVVDRSERTADVRADTAVECLVLPAAALERLGETNPPVAMAVMRNLLRNCHGTVNRLSREVAALEG
jgi:glutaminase